MHVPSGEPPGSLSRPPAKRKEGVIRPITQGKLLRKGGPDVSLQQVLSLQLFSLFTFPSFRRRNLLPRGRSLLLSRFLASPFPQRQLNPRLPLYPILQVLQAIAHHLRPHALRLLHHLHPLRNQKLRCGRPSSHSRVSKERCLSRKMIW